LGRSDLSATGKQKEGQRTANRYSTETSFHPQPAPQLPGCRQPGSPARRAAC
jgi:hypothetical protein